jgi:hypothetical protein
MKLINDWLYAGCGILLWSYQYQKIFSEVQYMYIHTGSEHCSLLENIVITIHYSGQEGYLM